MATRKPPAAKKKAAPAPAPLPQDFVDLHRSDAAGPAELFGINELCQQFGITLRALRFYEDKGLLAPMRLNGARVYTRRDRARLTLILRGKAFGMPLAEIKRLLDMYGDHGEGHGRQLSQVMERTARAITELEARRAQIDQTLAELRLIYDKQAAARKRAGG
jgi:DNA-binding transcriptional MerR regulator